MQKKMEKVFELLKEVFLELKAIKGGEFDSEDKRVLSQAENFTALDLIHLILQINKLKEK